MRRFFWWKRHSCSRASRGRLLAEAPRRAALVCSAAFLLLTLFPMPGRVLAQSEPSPSPGGEIRGVVKSAGNALPGVAISAADPLTGQKVVTSTDVDGSYVLRVPADGRYVVRAELAAFAPVTREAVLNASHPTARVDLELLLLSRARQQAVQQRAAAIAGMAERGFQNLDLMPMEGDLAPENEAGEMGVGPDREPAASADMPVPGISPDSPTESVAVSGTMPNADWIRMSGEEMRQRIEEMGPQRPMDFGGGPGGGRMGGPGDGGLGGGGPLVLFGGRGRFGVNRPRGMVFYTRGDSALDAAPYSLTGQPQPKPSYRQNRFGATVGGPLNIPKLYQGGDKTAFFVTYDGSRAERPYDAFTTVPTLEERGGNFSNAVISLGPRAGQPATLFDPVTQRPFENNVIPPDRINLAALGLLPFLPKPNLPGNVQNFHFVTSTTNNVDNLNIRLMHNFGTAGQGQGRGMGRFRSRSNLNAGFRYQSAGNVLTNPFPSVGGDTSTRSFDVPIGYVRSLGRLTNMLRVDFNRNRVSTRNLYAFTQDVASSLGISGVSQNPFDWGLPNLSFTNFADLRDINSLLRRDQTVSISDSLVWSHGRHTWRWGGDFRRIQHNTQTNSNARGSFTFTGLNTAQVVNGAPAPGTGFDFADFLLGLPQLTAVQFGASSYYFRGNSWDLFVQDNWRVRGNLTWNLGLRYEYVSPFREIHHQIVNLDVAPGFTAVAPVLPGQTGAFTGVFPVTLVRPDRNNFAPRLGVAWRPFSRTVVRAGYGINYNTGAYSNLVQQLAFQPPFSITQTNIQSPRLPLTLENGFPPAPPSTVTNNYGVNPSYRLGYVQTWNFNVQRELPGGLLLNLDYTGTKGTRLDIVEAPNRGPGGLRIPGAQPFLWETSDGNSLLHSGTVRLRKRTRRGISLGGTYTFSKSLDNASTIGGGVTVVAQNAFDLAAERGPSSFDQRHRFTADYVWELPFGQDKRWFFHQGPLRNLLGDWQWSGSWTIASGSPFTARVLGDFTDVRRGTNGTLRAEATGQPVALSDPSVGEWFNTGAFVVPAPESFGSAGRNTIRGPGSVLFNMALTKVIPLGETHRLEVRAQANNVFNTPPFTAIDTVVNSPSYGQVTSVGSMRKVQMVARFRF